MMYRNTANDEKVVSMRFDNQKFKANISDTMLALEKLNFTGVSKCGESKIVKIEKVIFNDPATIVIWSDGVKTVVKCMEGDTFDAEKGLAMAIAKRALGNDTSYHKVFKEWLPEPVKEEKIEVNVPATLSKELEKAANIIRENLVSKLYSKTLVIEKEE